MAATKKIRIRVYVVFLGVILLLGAVSVRLFHLQVLEHSRYIKLAWDQSQGNLLTLPVRGKIFDRNMNPLAESLDTKSVVMRTASFDPKSESLQRVSNVLDISLEKLETQLPTSTQFTYLKRKLSPEELATTQALWAEAAIQSSGIFLIPDTKRFYPQRCLASHILGFTGFDEQGYDNHGLEGLEFYYDHYLRGQAERLQVPMDAKRNSLNSWALELKNAGYNLILTIDKNIQYMVERELENTFRNERARHAIVIVMDPHTGEILAMANHPDYDPNDFAKYPPEYYRNRAVAWDYEPGSTFKIIQTAAAFEEGILSPSDRYDNHNGFLDGSLHTSEEWQALKFLSVEDILVQSSNLGAMKISEQLGIQRFYEYMKRFGFGELTGIDLPGELSGTLREPKDWSSISLQSLSIGQEISVTPLQMARAFAVIANGGMLYTPYVVREIQQKDGTPVLQVEPTKVRRVISRRTAEMLRNILTHVVEQGTGKRAAVNGYRVAGKTGTAQKFNRAMGNYSSTSLVTSFIGFAPADYPQVVIAAIIDEPALNEWGGTVAAPLFKRITERILPYLDISPEQQRPELVAWMGDRIDSK
ncbi:division-specific transpeptidase, penicillin-binding protein [Candidatus Vecturithrix granuli]|uniref:Division-specific transpeptidase, penicillin-binding protein n=1 Tax=Vecturithrix granuli TaxID=1499967 RepID=A0A081BU02_VECG1|nr:division-specific transpeptidase, penicillin-binding protein [Candidatus Vecturithrix granuli]